MSRKIFSSTATAFLVLFLSGTILGLNSRVNTPLTLNAPITREFTVGERQFFTVSAQPGETIEITCERHGVDIGLTVFAPSGEKTLISNAPSGFAGFDKLFFVAAETGEYRVEISSRRPGSVAGSFTMLLKNKRPANTRDLTVAAAAKLLGEAREILFGAEDRLEKASRALEKLEKAHALFEKSEDFQGQAETLFQMAVVNGSEFGYKAKAIEYFETALGLWKKLDDEAGRAICLTYLANEIRDYDRPDKDRSFYKEAGHAYFKEALETHRKLNNRLDEATALTSLCRFYNDTGEFQKGFESCRESLRLTHGADPLTEYLTYGNLASLSSNSGDLENAVKYNRTALEQIEIVKDYINPYRKAFIKSNLGILLLKQKNYEVAEKELREALKISEAVKRTFYSGYILVRIGSLLYETNRLPEALEAAERGVENYRQSDPVKIQAALNCLGRITLALGQTEKARALFTEAVEINRKNQDRYAEAESLYNLAGLENQLGELDKAHENIARAIQYSEINRAQLLGKNQRTSYLSILKKYYELEIQILIKLQNKNPNGDYVEQAWQRHERIRARALMETLIESGLNLNEFAPGDYYAKEHVLLEAIAAAELKRSESVKSKNPARKKSAEDELAQKLNEYAVLQEDMRKINPRFSAINQPPDFALADAQKLLDERTAIVEFALGEQQSYIWVIRHDSVRFAVLAPRSEIESKVRDFYVALTDRVGVSEATIREKSRDLSRAVLSPVAAYLKNTSRMVFIADGALQLAPFSALTLTPETTDFQPILLNAETINAPSFASLVYLRETKANRPKSGDKLLAVFADPVFQQDDERFADKNFNNREAAPKSVPDNLAQNLRDFGLERLARLPFSGIEAREIGKFAPAQTFLALGVDASRQNFLRGDFSSYRFLHFATHGFLNQQTPELSGLVLSLYDSERNAQNGFLRVIDIYSLRLNSDLVVLSACQTALGKEIDGEGIVGLTRGFMYAGASGVVSSLWKVEDAATAELMKRFYHAMLVENQPPSAALRSAKIAMRRIPRFSNPRFWAGFSLNGEWQ